MLPAGSTPGSDAAPPARPSRVRAPGRRMDGGRGTGLGGERARTAGRPRSTALGEQSAGALPPAGSRRAPDRSPDPRPYRRHLSGAPVVAPPPSLLPISPPT